MANSISVKVSDIDVIIEKVDYFIGKFENFNNIFYDYRLIMLKCCKTGPEGINISPAPIDKMLSSLQRFKLNLVLTKELIEQYSDGLTDEYLKEMLPLIYVSENSQDEYKNKITEDSWLKVAESDATYLKYSDSLLMQKISEITGAIATKPTSPSTDPNGKDTGTADAKNTSPSEDPDGKGTGTADAKNTAAIISTGSFTSAVQPRYSSTGSSSQTNLTQNNDTSANTSKNTFSSSDSKSNTSTSSPETASPSTTSTTAPPSTASTTAPPSTASTTAPTPSTSQTTSTTILTPKNNSNNSSSGQVHTGGGYSSRGGYTGTGDYNSDTSNATPSTPSTPETMAPGNTSKLSDEELTSIKNVIDNSKTHTTIPTSNIPINNNTKSGGGSSSVIPIAAGLTAAAAAGLGAKAYLDRKNNNDNGSSDEINTDEWTGDESVDIKYDDSGDNQEDNTLDADDDYSYQ